MAARHVLIVDDEPDIRELLEITLGRMDINTKAAKDLQEAKQFLNDFSFDLCLTDMKLPDGNGIELVGHIQDLSPDLPVAVITAFGSMDAAINALKAGAFDFVSKPVDLQRLRDLVNAALKLKVASNDDITVPAPAGIIGKSDAVQSLKNKIQKLARSQAPVYINGESGSGKEMVAHQIHDLGSRAEHPFVPVNCGAIPTELMESEFFGHVKGSFTGANDNKQGLFQAADGGTLFLDEVADLPLNMQVKLLRAIQEKAVRPVGGQKEISVDVRILSATHKDLAKEVELNHFRQDLFYRINVIQLTVPPLRSRSEDVPLLTEYFLNRVAMQWQAPVPTLSPGAINAINNYQFPGNVRELENILERALTLCEDDLIETKHLQLPNYDEALDNEATPPQGSDDSYSPTLSSGEKLNGDAQEAAGSLEDHLVNIEKQAILKALDETHWNRTAAAKKLGMSFRALRYRLKKLGLDQQQP